MKIAMRVIPVWLSLMLGVGGCARVEKVRAIEADTQVPYVSLGTLETNIKAYRLTPRDGFWTTVELASLGFADTPSAGDHYKSELRQKLARIAAKRYGADSVINVEYWPDPEMKKFPDGIVYARGEMIRYLPFPERAANQS